MMHKAVANTVRFTGLSLREVLAMAAAIPAQYLGIKPIGSVAAEWDEENHTLLVDHVAISA